MKITPDLAAAFALIGAFIILGMNLIKDITFAGSEDEKVWSFWLFFAAITAVIIGTANGR